jgi:2-polyprenyl-6-methoxyphenol hydroxylase-like FAD-dependent oxidoreductase
VRDRQFGDLDLMPCILKALMIGGGIAGLSSAIALSRAGVKCTVLEIAKAPLGASLGLSGRAADALAELGVYDQCYETSTPFDGNTSAGSQNDASGKMISPGPQRPSWPDAKTALGVYRPVFLQVLADEAKRLGADIRLGVTAEAIDEQADGAMVTFNTGEKRLYDLVVGADGIGSRTRQMVFPDAPKPEYAGQISIRWMLPGPPVKGEGWYISPLGRFGFYYLPQGMVYVPAVITEDTWVRKSPSEVHALFARLLDSYTAPAALELKARLTPDSDLICRPFDWIMLQKPWHIGHTLLIGDAAHATTASMGMGGGMAVEDAVVLGQCIGAANTLDEALTTFMERRFERVRTVVETSLALSRHDRDGGTTADKMAMMTKAFATIAQPY